jgi:hypothetical protein
MSLLAHLLCILKEVPCLNHHLETGFSDCNSSIFSHFQAHTVIIFASKPHQLPVQFTVYSTVQYSTTCMFDMSNSVDVLLPI